MKAHSSYRFSILVLILTGGCGSGIFDRLGDIPDHCKIGPAAQGWIDLNLQCVAASERPKSDTTRKRPDNNDRYDEIRYVG